MGKENKFDIVHFILGILISIVISYIGLIIGQRLFGLYSERVAYVHGGMTNILSVFPFIANCLGYAFIKQPSVRKGILLGFAFSILYALWVFSVYMQFNA